MKLVLIDGNALLHRAYHALPKLTTKKGELVNAVYGFVSILLKVIKEIKPDYIAASFDLGEPTFRHNEYEAYKATRIKAPQELYDQLTRVKEILNVFSIPIFEKSGFEADDVIGTLAKQAERKSELQEPGSVLIVSGDLDTLQLVTDKINVYTPKKGIKDAIIYTPQKVEERYGLKPEQLADFKGLKGDPSDNIPGVPGIGEKTASELLKEYGSLENLYANLEFLPSKISRKLEENKEQAFFSKYLTTIKTDVPIRLDLEKCKLSGYDKNKVKTMFEELEFYSLLNRLP